MLDMTDGATRRRNSNISFLEAARPFELQLLELYRRDASLTETRAVLNKLSSALGGPNEHATDRPGNSDLANANRRYVRWRTEYNVPMSVAEWIVQMHTVKVVAGRMRDGHKIGTGLKRDPKLAF